MALDNFDRVEAVNDVVKAWTAYASLPFITRKTLSHGQSWTFQATDPFEGVVYSASWRGDLCGLRLITYIDSAWTVKAIANSANLGNSTSGNRFTYRNNDTAKDVDIYIIALKGIIEDV